MNILGIDTSCDDTGIGILKDGQILSNVIYSQDHKQFGGVFPEHAAREHISNIGKVFDEALDKANLTLKEIDVIAATYAPGLIGSLLVGLKFGEALAYSAKKQFIPVHHVKGHIYAAMIEHSVALPAIALVVSGSHTSLIHIDKNHNFKEIGHTIDDALGETYDKLGRIMGLDFPAGREIDNLSRLGENNFEVPKPRIDGYNFSFSGIKSHMYRNFNSSLKIEDVATSFQRRVESILLPKSIRAFKEYKAKSFILAGGVACNTGLRAMFKKNFDNFYVPSPKLCLDNGAMIAATAHFMMKNNKKENYVRALPNLVVS